MTAYARITAFTHRGRVRDQNEDTIAVGDWVSVVDMPGPEQTRHELGTPLACVIADGMGGHNAGEVASRYVVRRLAGEPEELIDMRRAAQTLRAIDSELYRAMAADPDLRGMGTTVVGLVLAPRLVWFNVGDSRLYRCEAGGLVQMSIDDVPPGPRSGLLTQTLGGSFVQSEISPHAGEEPLNAADRFLLCSDGLTDMLASAEIEACMKHADFDAASMLFERAMRAGGADNVSIVIASVE